MSSEENKGALATVADVCEAGHNWMPGAGTVGFHVLECDDCEEIQVVGHIRKGYVTVGSKPVLNCRHARTFVGVSGRTFCRGCSEYVD